jgi:ubiquinone/menaquinone biosynthesis C-methylase UbiE
MEQPQTISDADDIALKQRVHAFWNAQSCDTQVAKAEPFSKQYFEEIEAFRYFDQPFIHAFAQFTRFHKKRVLEVGFGAGTDFIQWLRAGAIVTGVDLTEEALRNLSRRIELYELPAPAHIGIADAEKLPFADNSFDLGYSFGVLHHTPDTEAAIREMIRVVKPGGEIKLMLYNRRSIYVLNRWVKYALLRGRFWKSLRWVLWNHTESAGTKGYTRGELQQIFNNLPIEDLRIETHVTSGDFLSASALPPLNWLYRLCLAVAGYRFPWRPWHYVDRANFQEFRPLASRREHKREAVSFGNPLGFFHCISGRKGHARSSEPI